MKPFGFLFCSDIGAGAERACPYPTLPIYVPPQAGHFALHFLFPYYQFTNMHFLLFKKHFLLAYLPCMHNMAHL